MSVPSWKREESRIEYLWQIYQFTIRMTEICSNKPKKYKNTFSGKLINMTCDAFTHAKTANEIYIKTQQDYELRRNHLQEVIGLISSICTLADIFLETCKKSPECKEEKVLKEQEYIGSQCFLIINLVKGVMNYDKKVTLK